MDINFDPEKQFYEDLNPTLEEFVRHTKCKFLFGDPHSIEDIGRDWQEENNVKKHIENGASFWTSGKNSE